MVLALFIVTGSMLFGSCSDASTCSNELAMGKNLKDSHVPSDQEKPCPEKNCGCPNMTCKEEHKAPADGKNVKKSAAQKVIDGE